MTRFLRFDCLLLVVAVGVALFCWTFPVSTRNIGLDFWNYSAAVRERDHCERELANRENISRLVNRRLNLKVHVVRELIDGRVELADAALQFRDMNRTEPNLENMTCQLFPAASPDVSHTLQVMTFVRCQLEHDPLDHSRRLEELEFQLCEILQKADLSN